MNGFARAIECEPVHTHFGQMKTSYDIVAAPGRVCLPTAHVGASTRARVRVCECVREFRCRNGRRVQASVTPRPGVEFQLWVRARADGSESINTCEGVWSLIFPFEGRKRFWWCVCSRKQWLAYRYALIGFIVEGADGGWGDVKWVVS